jgi:hypothetical protein
MWLQVKMLQHTKLNKKGVSIMIGYVLLVTSAVVMGVIVYQWIKTYVPTETLECPEGVSIFLKEYSYDCDLKELNITLKNNGRFNVAGYFIHGTNDSTQELATIDLSSYTPLGKDKGGSVLFGTTNSFEPSEGITSSFDLSNSDIGQLYSIEIFPVRFQEEKGKNRFVSCGNAKIKETINCKIIIESSCNSVWEPPENEGVVCDGGEHCIDAGEENECTCELGYLPNENGECELITCVTGQAIGDLDGDEDIDNEDAIIVAKIYSEELPEPENICCGDVYQNEDIDILDALLISQIINGDRESPGVC